MSRTIYRSTSFHAKTKWNYPLAAVEIVIWETGLKVYTYDIGFEPPFYDVNSDPSPFCKISPPYTKEKGIKILEEKGIFAAFWYVVDNLLAYECNALIRADIRTDVRKFYGYEEKLPEPISRDVGLSAVNTLSRFAGQPVKIHIKFLEKCTRIIDEGLNMLMMYPKTEKINELRTYTGIGLLQFRKQSQTSLAGLLLENPSSDIAPLTFIDTEYTCVLCDFSSASHLCRGVISEVVINLINQKKTFMLNSRGLTEI